MKIEKLNEDKIRITLDINDLKEKNIDFHSFMSNSLDSQSIFLDMLAQAEEEFGFTTKDYRIMIEALATSDGNFILTVTRLIPDIEKDSIKKKKVKIKRKSPTLSKDMAVYEFNSFDDFCDFCTSFDSKSLTILQKSFRSTSLYLYNSSYYLVLKDVNATADFLKGFCSHITEFGNFVHKSKLFYNKLSEYGKIVIKKNAIKTCIKHFK